MNDGTDGVTDPINALVDGCDFGQRVRVINHAMNLLALPPEAPPEMAGVLAAAKSAWGNWYAAFSTVGE